MRTAEKIIAVLCCLICLSACGDKEVSDVSENITTTESVTTETTTVISVNTTTTSAEIITAETIPQTTSTEIVTGVPFYFDEENEVPENAAYKEIVLNYSKYHGFKMWRYITFYDIHDNPILDLYQVTSEQTVPSKYEHFYEYNSDGTKSSEEYDTMHGRNHIDYEYDEYNNPVKSVYKSYDYEYSDYELTTTYTYEYDDNGRFISRITRNTDDYQRIEKFTYDENGNIESCTDNNMKINYTYDSNDRLIEIRQYDEDGILWYELYEYEFYK